MVRGFTTMKMPGALAKKYQAIAKGLPWKLSKYEV